MEIVKCTVKCNLVPKCGMFNYPEHVCLLNLKSILYLLFSDRLHRRCPELTRLNQSLALIKVFKPANDQRLLDRSGKFCFVFFALRRCLDSQRFVVVMIGFFECGNFLCSNIFCFISNCGWCSVCIFLVEKVLHGSSRSFKDIFLHGFMTQGCQDTWHVLFLWNWSKYYFFFISAWLS